MKRYLLAGTALAVLPVFAAPANANSFSWTGFYVGVQGGGVRSQAGLSGAYADTFSSSVWTADQSWTSGLFGGFAGFDYQVGRFVIGVEGDLNARFGEGTGTLPLVYGIEPNTGWNSHAHWDAGIRGRLGVLATDQILLYVTGGWAFANFNFSNPGAAGSRNLYFQLENIYGGDRSGWSIGGGIQYAMSRNWSARVEFRHTDYGTFSGTTTFDSGKGPGAGTFQSKLTDDRVTGGLAYRF